jgi:hypothetical protein
MDLRVQGKAPNQPPRAVAWISQLPDGSISVGLNGGDFLCPVFHARQYVWNAYNRVQTQYFVPSDGTVAQTVRDPHFTFHPATLFHLRESKKAILFEGIMEPRMALRDQSELVWLRLASRRLGTLKDVSTSRPADRVLELLVDDDDCSLGVSIDFIAPHVAVEPSGHVAVIECAAEDPTTIYVERVRVRVAVERLATQQATLRWFHEA